MLSCVANSVKVVSKSQNTKPSHEVKEAVKILCLVTESLYQPRVRHIKVRIWGKQIHK